MRSSDRIKNSTPKSTPAAIAAAAPTATPSCTANAAAVMNAPTNAAIATAAPFAASSNVANAAATTIEVFSHAATATEAPSAVQSKAATAAAAMIAPPSVTTSTTVAQNEALLQAMQKQIQELAEQVRSAQNDLRLSELHRNALEDALRRTALGSSATSQSTPTHADKITQSLPLLNSQPSSSLLAVPTSEVRADIFQSLGSQSPRSANTPALSATSLTYSHMCSSANLATPAPIYPSSQPLPVTGNAVRNSCFVPNVQTSEFAPFNSENISATSPNLQLRKLYDLPEFSGQPEDWPLFSSAYAQTTAAYNYNNFENNQRLQRCLRGEARETVKSLLIHPDNVSAVMNQLQFRYGRPEQLIRSQLRQIREIAPISESAIEKLIPFATKANNLAVFLKSVNGQQHLSNPTLLEELITKLPISKRVEWARYAAPIQPYPTILDFSNWLTEIANLICTVSESSARAGQDQKRRVVLHTAKSERQEEKRLVCPVCQGQHRAAECKKFLELSINDRWAEAKRCHMCFTCLLAGHSLRNCTRRKPCHVNNCQKRHHKLLHEDRSNSASNLPNANDHQRQEVPEPVLSCVASPVENQKLLFRVLPVTLYGPNKQVDTYALMDEGSSISMMDSALIDILGLQGSQRNLNVQWFAGTSAHESSTIVNVYVSGTGLKKKHLLRDVYGVSNLCLPTQSLNKNDLRGVYSTQFSAHLYADAKPQLLIGLDHCHLGMPKGNLQLREGGPFAVHTELGWVVFGPTGTSSPSMSTNLLINSPSDQAVHNMVAEYFKIENFGVRPAPIVETSDDLRARSILEKSTIRVDGRFQTGLLWKSDNVQLPNNFAMAEKRLIGIERKMKRDVTFAASYKAIIRSYVEKNYARKLHPEEAAIVGPRTWYLPHFAVSNPNKPKKLRLVFDAAAAVDGTSLNTYLLKGPQQYQPIHSIIFNFRCGAIAVCGDIREMFHQVMVQPEDRSAQRFLWRDGIQDKPPDVYEMLVMTFGAACSPCAAYYVKNLNAMEYEQTQPRAVKAILEHHYVDDYVDCYDSVSEAIQIAQQVREIHKAAGFELHKFTSNSSEVAQTLCGSEASNRKENYFLESSLTTEKVLGLYWQPQTDTFKFKMKFDQAKEKIIALHKWPTKRELLSVIMSVFDPLGFLSNFMISAKLLVREVWRHNVGWDETLPSHINAAWGGWCQSLKKVVELQIPRHYFRKGKPKQLELHVFVDASEEAFSAVAYWRSVNIDEEVEVTFVSAKTKCSPLKPMTVPRLELQAAVLGARLTQSILNEHSLVVNRFILWSDSKTVIKWILSENRRYKPFVAHRIAEILAATDVSNWRWISTRDNVADEATRLKQHHEFSVSSRWFQGPKFLMEAEDGWPHDNTDASCCEDDEEELPLKYNLFSVSTSFIDFKRFSSLSRLKRTVAWVIRLVDRCRRVSRPGSIYGLTAAEIEAAELVICRLVQAEAFSIELSQVKNAQCVSKGSSLYKLSPYVDDEGTLRSRGRIDAASCLPFCTRRPTILPPDHVVTRLIVHHYHCQMKHQNSEATICEIRRKYWIPRLRQVLRSALANCYVCRILRANPVEPMMGMLPVDRLTPYVRPFSFTGLDYFGPLTVTIGRRTEKRWIALFTCLAVRAVHLEVAFDLSTDACILAIRNFINRRGVPVRLRSDNGKNFVGADQEAKRFSEVFECERIQDELSSRGIEWVFNCPSNPSEGGVWERMVQCVKRVLRHTLKEVAPREYTLQSFIIEAESVVNSRPLTHLPIAVNQEEPLTPNHFLIGSANNAQTPCMNDVLDKPCVLRKQWRIARQLRDRFWKRWIAEYLPTLLRRPKWCQPTRPLQEGDLVFICDANLPRKQWCRGRVERVYKGADDIVRRADVRTQSGVLRRPVTKLAILDLDCGELDSIHGGGDVPE